MRLNPRLSAWLRLNTRLDFGPNNYTRLDFGPNTRLTSAWSISELADILPDWFRFLSCPKRVSWGAGTNLIFPNALATRGQSFTYYWCSRVACAPGLQCRCNFGLAHCWPCFCPSICQVGGLFVCLSLVLSRYKSK